MTEKPNPYYHRRSLPRTAFSLPAQKISRTLTNTAVGRFSAIFVYPTQQALTPAI